MLKRKLATGLIAAALAVPITTTAHDKCDSLAIATTAGGVLWGPVAGFQVGYFLAKQIDESTSSGASANNNLKQACAATGIGTMSREQYASIVSPNGEDPNQDLKFLWDGAGALAQKSLALNGAVSDWQSAREDLRQALFDGDSEGATQAQAAMNSAHSAGMAAFDDYQREHNNFATSAATAAELLPTLNPPVPAMTVADVVASAEGILKDGPPLFEARYFSEIGCLLDDVISPQGVLAPTDRFVNDDVEPGTFISNGMLRSPSTLYNEVALTFGGEVVENLPRILPDGFANNDPLPLEMNVITEGRVGDNDLGVTPGTLHHTAFMIDLELPPVGPGRFIDPWQWHWIVGKPWDWLFGFNIEIEVDLPWPPDPGPFDRMRIIAPFDDPDVDMVMELPRGSAFIQDLYFPPGTLNQEQLPNATEMAKSLGGDFNIVDPSGAGVLTGSIDKVDPNPIHIPVTTTGTVGENQLGVEVGIEHQTSFMVDLKLTPTPIPGIFIDPWWWHWIVGKNPWDWLRGFTIEIEPRIPRPGDPDPWDRMRIVATFDEPDMDMVMELPEGSQFVQDLFFPAGSLSLQRLPDPSTWSLSDGGTFAIVDPNGAELLKGTIDSVSPGEAVDSDEDGVDDFNDNCTTEPNEDQRDTDRDGFGNACDGDLDNNNIVNTFDLARFKAAFGSEGEGLDADFDGNNVVNTFDLARFRVMFGKEPGPSALGMH